MRRADVVSKGPEPRNGVNGHAGARALQPRKGVGRRAEDAELAMAKNELEALRKSQAFIEFDLDGMIVDANDNFCRAMGYSLDEIRGKHHRMFVDPAYASSAEYRQFWQSLAAGEFRSAEFKRFGKGGKEVWIQASYNPIADLDGKPFKVVKYATDVTEAKLVSADANGQLAAIRKSQAVIEFNLKGEVLDANENFCNVLGYRLDEIKGRHHRMFVEPSYADSPDYRKFWELLNAGEYQAAEYKRIGKGGKEVWIQASYNPILDLNGKPFKIVKYATDITNQKKSQDLGRKVTLLLDAVDKAVAGDLTVEVPVTGEDSIGKVGNGLVALLGAMRQSISRIAGTAGSLAAAAEQFSSVSKQMLTTANDTSGHAQVGSAAAEQVTNNVQTVATGAEEMSASIREIAKNAAEAARVATSAVKVAENTNSVISKLGDSSTDIGKVIKVITSIAQQTNLLALNATIEAARAGEAGKGFAVVATEVKELAKETAKATEEISRKIEAIQSDTQSSVGAIKEIGGIIGQINELQTAIAGAVEEQSATTNEITRNVADAARGSKEIATTITTVAQGAQTTARGAKDSERAAGELSKTAAELQDLVRRFKY